MSGAFLRLIEIMAKLAVCLKDNNMLLEITLVVGRVLNRPTVPPRKKDSQTLQCQRLGIEMASLKARKTGAVTNRINRIGF